MILLRFIIRNALRNKRRTALTVLSIGFSLFLLIALFTFLDQLINPPSSEESALRLVVRRSTSLADNMPLSYGQKLRKVPHIVLISPVQWFGGIYKEPKNFFANLAVEPDKFWAMFPELQADEQAKRAFATERTGCIVGADLMKRFGWKVGDRITLQGTMFPVDLELKIVGVYHYSIQQNALYFRFDYFNESLGDPGQTGSFWLKADRAESIPGIIDAVDQIFRNSAAETKTETEKSFVLGFVAMLGNVRMMIGSIALVVVFTMLLVTASTMAMTIRERIREVAILKAIGYPRAAILRLILAEAGLIGLLGVALSVVICVGVGRLDIYAMTQGFIPYFRPPLNIYAQAAATGVGIGLLSGLVPALQASAMTITEAMRHLE